MIIYDVVMYDVDIVINLICYFARRTQEDRKTALPSIRSIKDGGIEVNAVL